MKIYLKLLALIIIGCGIFAMPITFTYAHTTENRSNIKMIKNLKNCHYPQQSIVNKAIAELAEGANNDEYRLGMVLLASAQQGDEKLYHQTLLQMQNALAKVNDNNNSYKTWRLGRILLAADSIDDTTTANNTLIKLKKLLADPNTKQDAFSAWAWGYLAAINGTEYKNAKDHMLTAATALTASYKKIQQNNPTVNSEAANDLQEKRSDALYAWIMALQAAANAQDKITYNFILRQIKDITDQSSLSAAIISSLHRNSESNDYPAWALGMVRLAAATIGDKNEFDELEKPLNENIQSARKAETSLDKKYAYSAKSEATLAQLYEIIGNNRWRK